MNVLRPTPRRLLLFLLSFWVSEAQAKTNLTFTAIPGQDEATMNARATAVTNYLQDYINNTCGIAVNIVYNPVANYQDAVDALLERAADFGWYGGLTGVQAGLRSSPSVYLAHRIEDTQFTSVFVQSPGLNLSGIGDVANRSLAYGSPSSTSGHLMPAYYLQEEGVDPATVMFTGSHDATLDVAANGTVEVGALNSVTWQRRLEANTTNGTSVFYTTPEYVDYLWVSGAGIVETWDNVFNETSPNQRRYFLEANCSDINDLLTNAFLFATNETELGAALLESYSTVGYVAIEPEEYNPIEETGCALDLIEEQYCSQPIPEDLGNMDPSNETCINSVQASVACFDAGSSELNVTFESCLPKIGDWVGIYDSSARTLSGNEWFAWYYTCGNRTCEEAVPNGVLNFTRAMPKMMTGTYVAHLFRNGTDEAIFSAIASSADFRVVNDCSSIPAETTTASATVVSTAQNTIGSIVGLVWIVWMMISSF